MAERDRACPSGTGRPRPKPVVRSTSPSYAALRRGAGKPVRECQQDQDEGSEYCDRRENSAHEEVRGLLEQSKDQASNDRAAIVAHPAKRHRHESIECEQRRVSEECKQKLAACKPSKRADRAGNGEACDAQVALRQSETARR